MKPKPKPKPKSKKITQSQLADALGVSRQLIAAHLKRGDAPKLDNIPGWHAHIAAHGRIGSQAGIELKREIAAERLAILKASRARLERENQIAAGELMRVADAERECAEACAFIDSELQRGENELPPICAGLSAVEIGKLLHKFTEQIRTNAKSKFEAVGFPD